MMLELLVGSAGVLLGWASRAQWHGHRRWFREGHKGSAFPESSLFEELRREEVLLSAGISSATETALVAADRSMQEGSSLAQVLLDNIAASIVIRGPRNEVLVANSYTEVLTGFAAEELMSGNALLLDSLVVPEHRERYERWQGYTALGEEFRVDYQLSHRQGFDLWLESRMVPLFDSQQKVYATLVLTVDITAIKNRQKIIEEQAQDIRDFTSMVSHDLKAPLFTIKGMSTALKEECEAAGMTSSGEYLSFIEGACSRLEMLVGSVLEYTEVSASGIKIEPTSLADVFTAVLDDYKGSVSTVGGKVTAEISSPAIMGDRVKLYQIFSNLVGNAVKYSDPSRPLELTLSARPAGSSFVTIQVSDNGLGIPECEREKIFRPFYRIPGSNREGKGIGLACVKKLVERLGGKIWVESTVGQGTTFTVQLPAASDSDMAATPPRRTRSEEPEASVQ